ncbi:autophagy-related protein 27 [Streptomyces sp. CNQ085]|nr:autophagy-related protein 27 [Streptomyces sp. CNQ085]MCI0384206.1 hypothetical protein [Streptomyces sp. CNQ085]
MNTVPPAGPYRPGHVRRYGARGWVAHHNTDLWRGTAPVDGTLFWGM